MWKKFCIVLVFFLSLLSLSYIWFSNTASPLSKFSNSLEVYQGSVSSLAKIIKVSSAKYPFVGAKRGESCEINGDFDLSEILSFFNAKTVFTEVLDDGISYYCFGDNLNRPVLINGKKINLHIFCRKDKVKIGTPLIFGAY